MPAEQRTIRIVCTARGQHRAAKLITTVAIADIPRGIHDPSLGFRAPAASTVGAVGFHWRCRCGRYDVALRPDNGYRVLSMALAAGLREVDISYLQ